MFFDCVVIGGGAAGLMCAATAGARGLSVVVIDHANKVGKKILMSGGGRCNFTNYFVDPSNFISQNEHFCKSALSRYTQYDFIELVEKYGLQYHEKTKGQLFCDNKAKDILNILLDECASAHVKMYTNTNINAVFEAVDWKAKNANEKQNPNKDVLPVDAKYVLQTSTGAISCKSLVVATGGLSIPSMGATGFGHDIAKQFGLKIVPRYASLVPFTLFGKLHETSCDLSGVSVNASVECNNQAFEDQILFTHRGLSGPAILQISNYWMPGDTVHLNFFPSESLHAILLDARQINAKISLVNYLSQNLPKRFVQHWLSLICGSPKAGELGDKKLADLSNKELSLVAKGFQDYCLVPNGTQGYKTAEVTKGGVDTNGVSSKTFESKNHSGLFFIGEVLDVTGMLGGFNFQWAWASGHCAGQAV